MKILKIIALLLLLSLLAYFGSKAYLYAKSYENSMIEIAKMCDASGLAQGKIDTITSAISFGLIKNKTKIKLDRLKTEKKLNQTLSYKFLYYFMATLLILIVISFSCNIITTTLILAISSLISLVFGLINPILMVTIHKNIDHLGDVILSFESKGLLGSIYKLFNNNEYAVALVILLFSVIIPFLKIVILIFTIIFKEYKSSSTLINFFKHLGKWSMLDVFVVAILLVYLTSNNAEISHAQIQIGLYFFLTYVILSMITTFKAQKIN
jgi:uncharacterized paraquat-inducible protein A